MKSDLRTEFNCTQLTELQTNALLRQGINQEIARQRRVVTTLVHPFYSLFANKNFTSLTPEEQLQQMFKGLHLTSYNSLDMTTEVSPRAYFDTLRNFFQSGETLIFILAESYKFLPFSIVLIRYLGYQGQILYYETEQHSSHPIKITWKDIGNSFAKLHIETLFVGGQNAKYQNHPVLGRGLRGCVPHFMQMIDDWAPNSKKFKTELSPISYPNRTKIDAR